jgi:TolA-binding protein
VRRGDYTSVLREAEHRGIDRAIDGAGVEDLGALADAARFTGRHDVARRALVALRDRFAGSVRAASAAFLLGRMLDEGGDAAGALVWYDRYLAEAPAGALAAEALGRRMLALRRLGEREAATTAASGYLRRFPAGPYASVANELVTP